MEANELLKNKALFTEFPKLIRQSSAEVIRSYIEGYFYADGSHTGNTKYIDTASKGMAQELSVIMRAIGINSKIRTYDKSKSKNS